MNRQIDLFEMPEQPEIEGHELMMPSGFGKVHYWDDVEDRLRTRRVVGSDLKDIPPKKVGDVLVRGIDKWHVGVRYCSDGGVRHIIVEGGACFPVISLSSLAVCFEE